MVTILVFILILLVLVLIHEAGHFFVAKWFGIKVEEFGFGFPPKAFGVKRGETEYTFNWLPIGGFVKLYGEDDAGGGKITVKGDHTKTKGDIKRAFYARPVWQRAAVVVAGVVMNALLAVVIFYVYLSMSNFTAEVPLIRPYTFFGAQQQNINTNAKDVYVTYIIPGSPAEKAGLVPHAKVVMVNGKPVTDRASFVAMINENKGKVVTLTWEDIRYNTKHTTQLTPRVKPPKNEGPLGIGFFPAALVQYKTQEQKIFSGITYPLNLLAYNYHVIAGLIQVSVEKKSAAPVSEGVSGPVGIFNVLGILLDIGPVKERFLQVINLAGLLSISLAFFNILPIPALDGGRLFFILMEGITGKKMNQRVEGVIHTVGMIVLLGLIILVTFKDIFQIFR